MFFFQKNSNIIFLKYLHLFVVLEIETLDHLETPLVQLH